MIKRSYYLKNRNYLSKYRYSYPKRKKSYFGVPYRIKLMDLFLYALPLLLLMLVIPPMHKEKTTEAAINDTPPISDSQMKVTVYNPEESLISEFLLEEYVTCVVAAEMPASFHEEALKAQAVAARTFALSRMKGLYGNMSDHFGVHVCTEPKHCQAWISKERFLQVYGNESAWEKIQKAVEETKNVVMTYDGILINPLYHSNSGGVTEDIDAVWAVSGEVPYLKSVYSVVDESSYEEYEKKVSFTWDEIKEKLLEAYPESEVKAKFSREIEVLSYTSSGRVSEIRIGSIKMSGPAFRELLSLRSTNLEISFPDKDTVEIVTRGYGHGVGMSQCGADAMGKKGYDYIKILESYYTGVEVGEIKQ